MNVEQLKVEFLDLKSNLENSRTAGKLKENNYDLNKLNETIEIYLKNIQTIESKELLLAIDTKIKNLLSYTRKSNILDYIHSFENDANFLISNVPKDIQTTETLNNLEITEEEFTKRFNSWLNLLNLKSEMKSNFTLLVQGINYEFYKTKENNILFIKVAEKKEFSSPEYINIIELINIVFKKENGNSDIAKIIANKIKDNSIFNHFIPINYSDLFEIINRKIDKNEDDLRNLQTQNQLLDDAKKEFYDIFEKSKTIDEKCESTINAAEKRAELGASVSYWQKKQERHKIKFRWFSFASICFIGILVCILFCALKYHENDSNKNETKQENDKNTQYEKVAKSDDTSQITEKKDAKLEPKELKVEKQGKDNKSLAIDINVQIEKVTQMYKEESKEISEKNNENDSLKDFDYSKLAWYALMIFASSSAFWIIRITVKIALSNLHLSEDAHERVVMIQTYLAFVKETEVKDKDKELILSSLFRPSNIGIIQDESSVTVTDIITAFKK
jgi:hypothetical protein